MQHLQRENSSNAQVLVLSARNALQDKVQLLSMGADDYITKPFEPEEVIARVQVALRRCSKISEIHQEINKTEADADADKTENMSEHCFKNLK